MAKYSNAVHRRPSTICKKVIKSVYGCIYSEFLQCYGLFQRCRLAKLHQSRGAYGKKKEGIFISLPKPVLPSHDSASYELLSLTALCGEFPCDSAARLIGSESYRKKIVTGLTHNRLLRIFSRNHLRGYRLGIRGKRLLQDQEAERFLFYLSGCGDTNAIKSEPSRRLRLHRIARTYITMKYAGITIFS